MNWQAYQAIVLSGTLVATVCTAVFTGWRALISLREFKLNKRIAKSKYPELFTGD